MIARTWAELKNLSEDELIAEHDDLAGHTDVGLNFYLEELRYRHHARVASKLEGFTKWILWLTVVVTLATVVNVAVAIVHSLGLVAIVHSLGL